MSEIIYSKTGNLTISEKKKLEKLGKSVIVVKELSSIKTEKQLFNFDEYVFDNCYSCGDRIYLTKSRMEALKKSKKTFYCPQGHNQVYI